MRTVQLLLLLAAGIRSNLWDVEVRHLRGDGDGLALKPRPEPGHHLVYRRRLDHGGADQETDAYGQHVERPGRREPVVDLLGAVVEQQQHAGGRERHHQEDD